MHRLTPQFSPRRHGSGKLDRGSIRRLLAGNLEGAHDKESSDCSNSWSYYHNIMPSLVMILSVVGLLLTSESDIQRAFFWFTLCSAAFLALMVTLSKSLGDRRL
jgi:hypothetical protein